LVDLFECMMMHGLTKINKQIKRNVGKSTTGSMMKYDRDDKEEEVE